MQSRQIKSALPKSFKINTVYLQKEIVNLIQQLPKDVGMKKLKKKKTTSDFVLKSPPKNLPFIPISQQGWLVKIGRANGRWQKRYFMLQDLTLSFDKSQEVVLISQNQMGTIPIPQIKSVKKAQKVYDRSFSFCVLQENKINVMQAACAEEMEDWITSLRVSRLFLDVALRPTSDKDRAIITKLLNLLDILEKNNLVQIQTFNKILSENTQQGRKPPYGHGRNFSDLKSSTKRASTSSSTSQPTRKRRATKSNESLRLQYSYKLLLKIQKGCEEWKTLLRFKLLFISPLTISLPVRWVGISICNSQKEIIEKRETIRLKKNTIVHVIDDSEENLWIGQVKNKTGWFKKENILLMEIENDKQIFDPCYSQIEDPNVENQQIFILTRDKQKQIPFHYQFNKSFYGLLTQISKKKNRIKKIHKNGLFYLSNYQFHQFTSKDNTIVNQILEITDLNSVTNSEARTNKQWSFELKTKYQQSIFLTANSKETYNQWVNLLQILKNITCLIEPIEEEEEQIGTNQLKLLNTLHYIDNLLERKSNKLKLLKHKYNTNYKDELTVLESTKVESKNKVVYQCLPGLSLNSKIVLVKNNINKINNFKDNLLSIYARINFPYIKDKEVAYSILENNKINQNKVNELIFKKFQWFKLIKEIDENYLQVESGEQIGYAARKKIKIIQVAKYFDVFVNKDHRTKNNTTTNDNDNDDDNDNVKNIINKKNDVINKNELRLNLIEEIEIAEKNGLSYPVYQEGFVYFQLKSNKVVKKWSILKSWILIFYESKNSLKPTHIYDLRQIGQLIRLFPTFNTTKKEREKEQEKQKIEIVFKGSNVSMIFRPVDSKQFLDWFHQIKASKNFYYFLQPLTLADNKQERIKHLFVLIDWIRSQINQNTNTYTDNNTNNNNKNKNYYNNNNNNNNKNNNNCNKIEKEKIEKKIKNLNVWKKKVLKIITRLIISEPNDFQMRAIAIKDFDPKREFELIEKKKTTKNVFLKEWLGFNKNDILLVLRKPESGVLSAEFKHRKGYVLESFVDLVIPSYSKVLKEKEIQNNKINLNTIQKKTRNHYLKILNKGNNESKKLNPIAKKDKIELQDSLPIFIEGGILKKCVTKNRNDKQWAFTSLVIINWNLLTIAKDKKIIKKYNLSSLISIDIFKIKELNYHVIVTFNDEELIFLINSSSQYEKWNNYFQIIQVIKYLLSPLNEQDFGIYKDKYLQIIQWLENEIANQSILCSELSIIFSDLIEEENKTNPNDINSSSGSKSSSSNNNNTNNSNTTNNNSNSNNNNNENNENKENENIKKIKKKINENQKWINFLRLWRQYIVSRLCLLKYGKNDLRKRVFCLSDYQKENNNELDFKENEFLLLLNSNGSTWLVENEKTKKKGKIPANKVQIINPKFGSDFKKIIYSIDQNNRELENLFTNNNFSETEKFFNDYLHFLPNKKEEKILTKKILKYWKINPDHILNFPIYYSSYIQRNFTSKVKKKGKRYALLIGYFLILYDNEEKENIKKIYDLRNFQFINLDSNSNNKKHNKEFYFTITTTTFKKKFSVKSQKIFEEWIFYFKGLKYFLNFLKNNNNNNNNNNHNNNNTNKNKNNTIGSGGGGDKKRRRSSNNNNEMFQISKLEIILDWLQLNKKKMIEQNYTNKSLIEFYNDYDDNSDKKEIENKRQAIKKKINLCNLWIKRILIKLINFKFSNNSAKSNNNNCKLTNEIIGYCFAIKSSKQQFRKSQKLKNFKMLKKNDQFRQNMQSNNNRNNALSNLLKYEIGDYFHLTEKRETIKEKNLIQVNRINSQGKIELKKNTGLVYKENFIIIYLNELNENFFFDFNKLFNITNHLSTRKSKKLLKLDPPIFKQGFLYYYKIGKINNKFQKCFIKLSGYNLEIYNNKFEKQPQKTINLFTQIYIQSTENQTMEFLNSIKSNKLFLQNCFQILIGNDNYIFASTELLTKSEWCDLLLMVNNFHTFQSIPKKQDYQPKIYIRIYYQIVIWIENKILNLHEQQNGLENMFKVYNQNSIQGNQVLESLEKEMRENEKIINELQFWRFNVLAKCLRIYIENDEDNGPRARMKINYTSTKDNISLKKHDWINIPKDSNLNSDRVTLEKDSKEFKINKADVDIIFPSDPQKIQTTENDDDENSRNKKYNKKNEKVDQNKKHSNKILSNIVNLEINKLKTKLRDLIYYDKELKLIKTIISNLDITQLDLFSKSIVPILEIKKWNLPILQYLIEEQVNLTSEETTLFRGNSLATKMLSFFSNSIAKEFLKRSISGVVVEIINCNKSFEISERKLNENDNLQENKKTLLHFAEKMINSIYNSDQYCPLIIRNLCWKLYSTTCKKFPNSKYIVLAGFIFLRFISPAIFVPEKMGITDLIPNRESRRGLILISKIIQNIANQKQFKEEEMYFLNDFVEQNSVKVQQYMEFLIQPCFLSKTITSKKEIIYIGEKNDKHYVCFGNTLNINNIIQMPKNKIDFSSKNFNYQLESFQVNDEQLDEALEKIFKFLQYQPFNEKILNDLAGEHLLIEKFSDIFQNEN
ncbi:neurofibromin [Anaeramoeba flamelloides]|uniref:Neurofibromin n=1 Tax=Anaeramoeba flamelloides TaxID=1746091 RepID=A0AAV7Z7G9_9EUKA|nr:neurofibromin [Anaeramoeba flamelloides]